MTDKLAAEKREDTALVILLKLMELRSVGIHPLNLLTLMTFTKEAVALTDKLHDELKK